MLFRKPSLHYLSLLVAIALGVILRFWNLGLKPLWLDEVITAIFALGKNYYDVPVDVLFPIERLQEIFTFKSGVSCPQIAENVVTQSNHPPLFFCLMHGWLGLLSPLGKDWVTKLRQLPALFGVAGIIGIYFANRIAFSQTAGLMAAALMAVSPFAVYLSQEARHYTLPMLLITLALIAMMQIQKDIFQRQRVRFWVWLGWVAVNLTGLYVHYFFTLSFISQILTFIFVWCWNRQKVFNHRSIWLTLLVSTITVIIGYLPWFPITLDHIRISETNWLHSPENIAPLYQALIDWVLMIIVLPAEDQPLAIAAISGLLMIAFGIWVGWQISKKLRLKRSINISMLTLLIYSACALLQIFAITYIFKKDITLIPRYNFVYYPSFCALLAASLTIKSNQKQDILVENSNSPPIIDDQMKSFGQRTKRVEKIGNRSIQNPIILILVVGLISSIFVVSNLAFKKSMEPEKVAHIMNQQPSVPLILVVAYGNNEDIASGLSFGLALKPLREAAHSPSSAIAFFQQLPDFSSVWPKLSQLPSPQSSEVNLWITGPGRRKRDYPQQVALSQTSVCTKDPKNYYRVGIPYQLYKCHLR